MEGSTIAAGGRAGAVAPLRVLGDEALVRLAARGSEAAFATIFERHHQALYRYALTILGNREDAFDAVQNATVKLLRSLPGERREIKLKPWLFRIVHNEAVSIARGRSPVAEQPPEDAGAEDSLEERMRAHAIIADLSLLGEQQRAAVALRELNGLSHAEIGAALSISESAAKQAVYEGRVALQEIEEGREMRCPEVQRTLSANDRRLVKGRRVRSHLRSCAVCRSFDSSIAHRRREFAAIAPLPAVLSAKLLAGALGSGGGPAGGLAIGAAGGAGATQAIGAGTLAKVGASAALVIGGGVALEHKLADTESAPKAVTATEQPSHHEGAGASAKSRLDAAAGYKREAEGGAILANEGASAGPEAAGAEHRVRSGHGDDAASRGRDPGRSPGGGGDGASGDGGAGAGGGGVTSPVGGSGGGPSGGGDPAPGGGGSSGGGAPAPEPDVAPGAEPPFLPGRGRGNGPAHGQEVARSRDPGYPGNSAVHSQKPPSPPGLEGKLPDLPDILGRQGLRPK